MQAHACSAGAPRARQKTLLQKILDERHSVPLRAAQVPTAAELTAERLLALYFAEGDGAEADCYWYFRPWRSAAPRDSGVYVRRQRNGYVGFAYYDADARCWLYTHDTVAQAVRFAEEYRAEASATRRYLSYQSNHQCVEWSAAPVAGLDDLDFSRLRTAPAAEDDDAAIRLALLRWTMDPQRKRRNFGG